MSAIAEGTPTPGQLYRISCIVLYPEGLGNPISVEWYGSQGRLSSGTEIAIRNSQAYQGNITSILEFSPFRTVYGGRVSCRAAVTSPAPPFTVSKNADIDIIVGGRFEETVGSVITSASMTCASPTIRLQY